MHNLAVFMEPSEDAWDNSWKGAKMILNRFCIDEDAAFELSGVNYLMKSSKVMIGYPRLPGEKEDGENIKFQLKRKIKGKEYSFLRSYFILRNLIQTKNS